MTTVTREQVEKLKADWSKDPCWDIEDSEGFEEFHDELLAFRNQKEAESKEEERRERRQRSFLIATGINNPDLADALSTFGEIENELTRLDSQIGDAGSAVEWASFVVSREQVRATLLLAAQVKRVADILEDQRTESTGESPIDFSTRLYKVD